MEINDTNIRRVASKWHSGQSSPLYALASTGSIKDVTATRREIKSCMDSQTNETPKSEIDELNALDTYVYCHGPRGPVNGWSNLNW